ncbi:MAG TPA: aldehyde dehydrogenase family protein [Candidatus Thioglobus sp.]|nr:aldehyde dehydrogenase family protein [Candidatus Thioglobus sp.]
MTQQQEYNLQFYINGEWCMPQKSVETLGVIDPSTATEFTQIPLASVEDVDHAVVAAKSAFEQWSETHVETRLTLMERFLAEYENHYEEMVVAISTEMGAPLQVSREAQAETGVGHTKEAIAAMRSMTLETMTGSGARIVREPIGVCTLITPWNWPINQIVSKVVPALLAGCCVVLKPSELTPLSADLFAQCIERAGFPPGVFNLIHGEGSVIGPALTSHPLVDMVSFTGSTRAGIEIARSAADTIKRVSQELGGKSANIIFADADLEAMVIQGVQECMYNTGQSCDAPTRMLVEASVYDKAVKIAKRATEAHTIGSAHQEGDHLGPVVSATQFEKIQNYIKIGIDEGAQLVAGGLGKPEGFEKGYFVKPTLFSNVNNTMRIAREEIFGPVLVIIRFEGEEEAIQIANDSDFGLGAYVSSSDREKARRVARRLKSGTVHINGAAQDYDVPFGGYKQSGNGREYSVFGIHEFQEIKAINGW